MGLAALLAELSALAFPAVCARCRGRLAAGDGGLCTGCLDALPPWPPDRCAVCAEGRAPLPGAPCAPCRISTTPLSGAFAALAYTGETETWVQRFKYPAPGLLGLDPAPGAVLAAALARGLAAARPGPWAADAVAPVPLHPRRLRERGFNPAAILARRAARCLGVAFEPRLLDRVRDTPSQTGLDRRARRRNVAGAFAPRPGRAIPARVWLVDDVVTTGATLGAAAEALRRAGAREVVGVCVARTPFAR